MKLRLKTPNFVDLERDTRYSGLGNEYDIRDDIAEHYVDRAVWETVEESATGEETEEFSNSDRRVSKFVGDSANADDAVGTTEVQAGETVEAPELQDFLSGSAKGVRDDIRDGGRDDELEKLLAIEEATADRKTVTKALRDRIGHTS